MKRTQSVYQAKHTLLPCPFTRASLANATVCYGVFSASLFCFSPLCLAQTDSTSQLTPITIEASTQTDAPITDLPTTAFSQQIIQRADFDASATSLQTLLQNQTQAHIRSLGGLGSHAQISLRGMAAQQVNIYLDGVLLNSAQGGGVDLSTLPLDTLERIELYPQHAPLNFAAQSVGGAVNLVSRRPDAQAKQGKPATAMSGQLGSFGYQKFSLTHQQRHTNGAHLVQIGHQQARNHFSIWQNNGTPLNPFDDFKATRHNAQTSNNHALLKFNWQTQPGLSLFQQLQVTQQIQHLPNQQNWLNNQAQLNQQQTHIQMGVQANRLGKNLWQVKSDIRFHQNKQQYLDPLGQLGLGKQHNHYTHQTTQWQTWLQHPIISPKVDWQFESLLSIQQQHYLSQTQQDTATRERNAHQRQTLSWQITTPFVSQNGQWSWLPSLQWQATQDHENATNGTTANPHLLNQQAHTAQLGVIYQLNALHQIKINVGNALRAPSFFELYADQGFSVGNPNLLPETSLKSEIQWQTHYQAPLQIQQNRLKNHQAWLKSGQFTLTFYQNKVRKMIIQNYNAQGIARSENQAQATILGSELQFKLTHPQGTQLTAGGAWQTSYLQSDYSAYQQSQLPNFPTQQANIQLQQPIQNWQVQYQLHYEAGAYYDRANLLPIATTRLHNVSVQYQGQHWQTTLQATNLLNQHIESFNGYPAPGRSYMLTLNVQL